MKIVLSALLAFVLVASEVEAVPRHKLRHSERRQQIQTNLEDTDACAGLSIAQTIKDLKIDPDSDLLQNSTHGKWSDFCTVVKKWNAKFTKAQFLNEENANNNILTLSAFLGNANHESDAFQACREYTNPCTGKCSGANPDAYSNDNWGTCYQMPELDNNGGWTMTGTVKEKDTCGTTASMKCTDWDGRPLTGNSCWFGRGALQVTWNCNYAKVSKLVDAIGLGKTSLCSSPDSICDDGETFFAASIAYWMMTVQPQWLQDHRIDTAMNCVKSGCSAPFPGTWNGSGAANRRKWFNTYMGELGGHGAPTPLPTPSPPPTAPTPAKQCGDWNSICVGCKTCAQCTSDPAAWQCNDA